MQTVYLVTTREPFGAPLLLGVYANEAAALAFQAYAADAAPERLFSVRACDVAESFAAPAAERRA